MCPVSFVTFVPGSNRSRDVHHVVPVHERGHDHGSGNGQGHDHGHGRGHLSTGFDRPFYVARSATTTHDRAPAPLLKLFGVTSAEGE
jgi:hypothetical protein